MVSGNCHVRESVLSFYFHFSPLIQPPLKRGCCVTKGCRPLSKSYSLVTGAVKRVETLTVSADACLSETCWALSKGKAGSHPLHFENNL